MSQFENKELDVFVVGGVGIDTIVRVPALTLPQVDALHVGPIVDYVAHTGNGVALALHALEVRTRLIDFIGADAQADLIHRRYRQTGLDFSYLTHLSGTRRSVNLVDSQGSRLSLYDGRHPPELKMPASAYLPDLKRTRLAHFTIMNWARDLYDDAQKLGVTVSTDLHDWDGHAEYHRDFAFRSDLVFLSTAALAGRHEAVMREILDRGRAQVVVAMAGGQGSYLLVRHDMQIRHFPCVDLKLNIVDTNGAGDAFVAGFLYGYLRHELPTTCMRLGSTYGAFACSVAGTAEAFLSTDELWAYARRAPCHLPLPTAE